MTADTLRQAFETWALNTPADERTNWEVFQAGARAAAQATAEAHGKPSAAWRIAQDERLIAGVRLKRHADGSFTAETEDLWMSVDPRDDAENNYAGELVSVLDALWLAAAPESQVQPKGTVPLGYRLIPEEFMDWVGALPASKAEQRLAWLHSSESNNVDGWTWGVFRVKYDEAGQMVSALHTYSDFSDLDAAMAATSGNRPSAEWYRNMIHETEGLDDNLPCGALAAPSPAPAPATGDTNGRRDGLRPALHGRVSVGGHTPGALADLLWASSDVMSLNAELGLSMDRLVQLTQAVLTAVPCAAVLASGDYVLELLVAAGHVTQAKVDQARTIAAQAFPSSAVTHGSDMLEPLIYAAMMHNGKPKTVAEFERVAANVADMLQRRAADAHEKPVASIYISADGSREFDDWRVDLPPGNHQLFTAPRPAQPQPESLPHPGAPEAEEMIDKLLAEYNRPANMKNAARAGYMAARRLLQNARQPLPAVEDAEPIGWGGVIETCAELCDPHFIAQQDLDELKRYAGNWNSTYWFFPIYAPGAQFTAGPAVLAERDALRAAIVELDAAEFAYARYIRSDGLEKHRQNRERRIAAWQAARKLVGVDVSNVPVQGTGDANG